MKLLKCSTPFTAREVLSDVCLQFLLQWKDTLCCGMLRFVGSGTRARDQKSLPLKERTGWIGRELGWQTDLGCAVPLTGSKSQRASVSSSIKWT